MSARKVRLIADMVRGSKTTAAFAILGAVPRAACLPVKKVIQSAVANATNNFKLAEDGLIIKTITVDQAPGLDRWRPRAHGSAAPIHKHACHITVQLEAVEPKVTETVGTATEVKAVKKTATRRTVSKKS